MWTILITLLSSAQATPAWATLSSEADWKPAGDRRTELGTVQLARKQIDGVTCVQGRMVAKPSPEALRATADQMVRSPAWSSAKISMSEELRREGSTFVLFQYFDVPAWTLAADRYWVIEGRTWSNADGGAAYRFERVDAAAAFPEVVRQAHAQSAGAVEPPINYGEWRFDPHAEGTEVVYRSCADFGGTVPDGIQRWIATSQLPETIADLVRASGG